MNFIWRIVIAALAVVFLRYIIPLFLTVLGVSMSGALEQLLIACLAAGAIAYVIWGKQTYQWGPPA
jgi:hypothetical protein